MPQWTAGAVSGSSCCNTEEDSGAFRTYFHLESLCAHEGKYSLIGRDRKEKEKVKQQYAPKLPGFLVCILEGSSLTSMSLPQCPGFHSTETKWQRPEWEHAYSGQFPDTDARRIRFESVYSMCLLVRSVADSSPRKRFTTSLAAKMTLSNKRGHKW